MPYLTEVEKVDPELADVIHREMAREFRGLELIASENFTSKAVLECLGTVMTNKYAEGEVGARYYGGTEYADGVERLAKSRSLQAFKLDANEWGVNVQPYSGSPANLAVYVGLLQPHDRIMGLDLTSGGHLTHGFYTAKKKISASSIFFESLPYHLNSDGLIDYDEMERLAEIYLPKMIIIGASAYARDYDYERVRRLCDKLDCFLFMDMAHTAGLIAGGVLKSPFQYADVVTTTTHKSLRGPRSGMIFYRKFKRDGTPTDYEQKINQAVFPALQGGPHLNNIAAIATQMREVCSPEWKQYAEQVQKNARELARILVSKGHTLISGGTDNHLILWNTRCLNLTGSKAEKLLEAVSISANKNTIPGDKSAVTPGGIRLGTCAITSRGFVEKDMEAVADFLDRAIRLALEIQEETKAVKVVDFVAAFPSSEKLKALRNEVEEFAAKFEMPSFDRSQIKYKNGIPH